MIENVRPYSPSQIETLKIYENCVLSDSSIERPDDIQKIMNDLGNAKTIHIKQSDVLRYKMWLEQNYKSPYTGQIIPLSKLFTPAYEIEHIIPQSRYFDDSLSNKVICESEVNKAKDCMLAYEFISQKVAASLRETLDKILRFWTKSNTKILFNTTMLTIAQNEEVVA